MEINVNEDKKIVEIWLSNEEKNNSLTKYKKTKYIVAVYESGSADLLIGTKSLLSQNRDIAALHQQTFDYFNPEKTA